MSLLKTLKLSAAQPKNEPANPTERGRAKLQSYISDQRALVAATIEGKTFMSTRTVTKVDEAGNRVRVEVPKTVRKGWFAGEKGKVCFQLRYGSRPLELAKGMTSVEVDKLEALPAVLDTLDQAVLAGEFDAVVATAAQERAKALKARKS